MVLYTTTATLLNNQARQRRKQQSNTTEDMQSPSHYNKNTSNNSNNNKTNNTATKSSAPLRRAAHRLTHMFHTTTATANKARLQAQQSEAQDVVEDALDSAYITTTVHSAFATSQQSNIARSARLLSLGAAISDYKWMNMLDIVQATLGVMSTLLWMVQAYDPYRDSYKIFMLQFILSIIYIFDFCIRVILNGTLYLCSKWAIIDGLTILPILYTIYQLGWVPANDTAEDGYIQFLTDFQVIWQFLTLARFLRLYKLLRIAELRKFTLYNNNVLSRGLTKLLLTVLTIIILGAGIEYLIENAAAEGNGMTFNQSLYFMVVTISTVGYGDITPSSVIGQVVIMFIILIAIIVIPMQTSDFIANLQEYAKYGAPYPGGRVPHVVLVAHTTMSGDDLDTLLHEFFHTNHQGASAKYDVVILCNGGEEHRKKLLYHIKSTQFWDQVKYILGSPSNVGDLQKASISTAQAVFLITSARFLDAEQELSADEETLLRAISIKHFCPYVPLIMHILSPRNKAHVLWYQLSKFPNIQVVCLNEMKMRLFASSCMCPGVLGLVTNLLSSYDGKSSMASLFSTSASQLESTHGSFVSTSTQTFSAVSLERTPLTLAAWPLSSAQSPSYPSAPIPPAAADGSSSLFFPSAVRRWEEEYLFGFGQEIYTAEFPECVDGYSFAEVAAVLYERLGVVLIGVYQADEQTGKLQVALNPGYSGRVRVRGGDLACVIAQNGDHAKAIKTVEYAHQLKAKDGQSTDIRDRWKRAREKDRECEQHERSALREQRRQHTQRRMKRQQSQRAKFSPHHAIDMPPNQQSTRSLNHNDNGNNQPHPQRPTEQKDTADFDKYQQPASDGSGEGERDSGAMSQSWPLSDEDGGEELGVLDALSSFRCNGQAVVPSIPASSYIAQLAVAEQQQERRQDELDHPEEIEHGENPELQQHQQQQQQHDPPANSDPHSTNHTHFQVQDKQTGHAINAVTGQITQADQPPSLVDRVLEGVGLQNTKEAQADEQKEAMDGVVEKHPELEDSGQHASAEEEDRKDANVFSPIGQQQQARDEPASNPHPHSSSSSSSSPPASPRRHHSSSSSSEPAQAAAAAVDYSDLDPYTGHIIVCGYIDTKIINFLRRLRDSDSRTVVLVFDNSVCFPLPPAVHAFIVTQFTNVYILFASSTYKARHQKDRLYLAYTSPCYGHHHEPPVELLANEREQPASALASATSVDGMPSELKGSATTTQPPLAMDEHTADDQRVHHALHLSGEITGPPVRETDPEPDKSHNHTNNHKHRSSHHNNSSSSNHSEHNKPSPYPKVAAYSLSINGAEGSHPMTYEEMLQRGSWFRRACVHRADSVLILANPYSSPAGSTSNASNNLDNPQSSMTQHLLGSILNATDRQSNSADEMLKADQFGLTIYSGIQAYLQQCRTAACPSLSMHVTATTFSIVNIELIHHSNVRLLKHDADTTEKYRPTEAVEAGWRWLWDAARHWYEKRQVKTHVAREKQSVRHSLQHQRRKVKRQHFATMRGVALKDEEHLDRHSTTTITDGGSNNEDENEEKNDRHADDADQDASQQLVDRSLRDEDARFATTLQDHFRAFYTADGLMFSGKILDALIVQAFFHPLVYDTVVSLVSGYAHTIPEQQFNRAMDERDSMTNEHSTHSHTHGDEGGDEGGGGGEGGMGGGSGRSEAGADPNDRTFRVELLLVDVPAVMAGRTYGFLALKLMLENGWVPLGLYRDRRAVVRLRQKTRLKSMLLDMEQRKAKQANKSNKSHAKQPSATQPKRSSPSTPNAPPPNQPASQQPSGAGMHRRASSNSITSKATGGQLAHQGSKKVKSAIELAEQQRRQQTFQIRGLSSINVGLNANSDADLTAKQRGEERRMEQLARRTEKLHRRHQSNPPQSAEAANLNTRTTDNGTVTTEHTLPTRDSQYSVNDTFTVQVATTLAKESNELSVRTPHSHGHHHHHHHHHPGKGGTVLGTHAERGGAYDADEDADHLDTSAQQHRKMTKLRQDTFEPPQQQQQQQESDAEEKRRERLENTTVHHPRIDQEAQTKGQQDYMRRQQPQHHHAVKDDSSDSSQCSSESSCHSHSDVNSDDEIEAESTNTPYTSRSLFYVLTNPPPDTILHARDRLYVLVQRWIKPTSAHRVLNGQSLKDAQEAVDREQQEQQHQHQHQPHNAQSDNDPNDPGQGSTANGDAGQQQESAATPEAMTYPRTYSNEASASAGLLEQHHHGQQGQQTLGGEQSIVVLLQQQLAQQQQMLQRIQQQLADMASAQNGQQTRQQSSVPASAYGTPSASGYSTPAVQEMPGSSQQQQQQQQPMSSFMSNSSRYQMPAEDEAVSYELQRMITDNRQSSAQQHPAVRRAVSVQSPVAPFAAASPSPPSSSYSSAASPTSTSAMLAPIAGAAHFGRPINPRRSTSSSSGSGSNSSHISITDASPTYSSSSSSLPLHTRTVSGDLSSLLLPASTSIGSSSSLLLFSPTSQQFNAPPPSLAYSSSASSSGSGSGSGSGMLAMGMLDGGQRGLTQSGSLSSLSQSSDALYSTQSSTKRPLLPPFHK